MCRIIRIIKVHQKIKKSPIIWEVGILWPHTQNNNNQNMEYLLCNWIWFWDGMSKVFNLYIDGMCMEGVGKSGKDWYMQHNILVVLNYLILLLFNILLSLCHCLPKNRKEKKKVNDNWKIIPCMYLPRWFK